MVLCRSPIPDQQSDCEDGVDDGIHGYLRIAEVSDRLDL